MKMIIYNFLVILFILKIMHDTVYCEYKAKKYIMCADSVKLNYTHPFIDERRAVFYYKNDSILGYYSRYINANTFKKDSISLFVYYQFKNDRKRTFALLNVEDSIYNIIKKIK